MWKYWLWEIWKYRGSLLTLLVVFSLTAVFFWYAYRTNAISWAAFRTPLKNGNAVVVTKSFHVPENKKVMVRAISYSVLLRIGQRSAECWTSDKQKWERTEVGNTVQISYHEGNDGYIIIKDWQPVSDRPVVDLQR